jgi:peptidoglycan/xylan/chitin deacetylase (PgdA/CDA1 family)
MSKARYLIRFDDICPTMNWEVWDAIEAKLIQHEVRPILAVVPDNRDPKLIVASPRTDFWERVRGWQSRGWTIALHGYQHLYVNKHPGIMRLTHQSEFAGLPREIQEAKLRQGLAIFAEQSVRADAWVAPSHSFDHTTVALLVKLGIPVISDGLWSRPFADQAQTLWIPQQLWDFVEKPNGIWTVCYHHNGWDERQLEKFRNMLEEHAADVTDVPEMARLFGNRQQSLTNRLSATWHLFWSIRLRSLASRILKRFTPCTPGP